MLAGLLKFGGANSSQKCPCGRPVPQRSLPAGTAFTPYNIPDAVNTAESVLFAQSQQLGILPPDVIESKKKSSSKRGSKKRKVNDENASPSRSRSATPSFWEADPAQGSNQIVDDLQTKLDNTTSENTILKASLNRLETELATITNQQCASTAMITHLEETVSSWKATHTAFQQKQADRLVLYAQREAAFKERESADKREWEEKEEQYKREIAALDDRVGSILNQEHAWAASINHLEETVSSWKATHSAFQQKHADSLVLHAQREAAFEERKGADERDWEEKEEQHKQEIAALNERISREMKWRLKVEAFLDKGVEQLSELQAELQADAEMMN